MGRQQQYPGIKPASKSSIEITFTYNGKRCRERVKLEPTPANLKRAANHRAAVMHAIDAGTFDYAKTFPNSKNAKVMRQGRSGCILLKDYLPIWFEAKKLEYKSSNKKEYFNIIHNHLIPAFGSLQLQSLKKSHVREWANNRKCSVKRIRNMLSPLRQALEI